MPCTALALALLLAGCVRAGFELPGERGAAPVDLAAGDAPGGDLAPGADGPAAPLCARWGGQALFCEDMDSPGGQLPSSVATYLGTAALDTGRYFAGRASLHGTIELSPTVHPFVLLDSPSSTTTVTSGDVFLRAHFFFESKPNVTGWAILMESRAKTTASNKASLSLNAGGLIVSYDGGNTPVGAPLPVGRWFCLELQVTVGANGSARAWLDGQRIAEATGLDTDQGLGHGFFRAGVIAAANTPVFSFNVDDFLATRTRAGCQ